MVSKDRLSVRASPAKGRSDLGFPLQALLTRLPEVVVHGIPTVQRAVINRQPDGRFQLFAEGTDLRVSLESTSPYQFLARRPYICGNAWLIHAGFSENALIPWCC